MCSFVFWNNRVSVKTALYSHASPILCSLKLQAYANIFHSVITLQGWRFSQALEAQLSCLCGRDAAAARNCANSRAQHIFICNILFVISVYLFVLIIYLIECSSKYYLYRKKEKGVSQQKGTARGV